MREETEWKRKLLADLHLSVMTKTMEKIGISSFSEKEFSLSRGFLKNRLSINFTKRFPVGRREEKVVVDYRLDAPILFRGEWDRRETSEQGVVEVLLRHDY